MMNPDFPSQISAATGGREACTLNVLYKKEHKVLQSTFILRRMLSSMTKYAARELKARERLKIDTLPKYKTSGCTSGAFASHIRYKLPVTFLWLYLFNAYILLPPQNTYHEP